MARMVPDGPEHRSADSFRFVEKYVDTLEIPAEIVWGNKDRILGRLLENVKAQFPDARVTETAAGHFLQEEVPDDIAAAIVRVVDAAQATDSRGR
jgi:pimeloyl-ACP methyl ester carboxylesterase